MELLIGKNWSQMKRKAWIFDVDGTLADVDSILHHVVNQDPSTNSFKKDFTKFHGESIDVPPHKKTIDLLYQAIKENGPLDIIVVTARNEEWRSHTSYWLAKNSVPHQALFMRADKDYRPDYEVKLDILNQIQLIWDVEHAVDDNPKIIKLWEQNGISTTKIGDWDGN